MENKIGFKDDPIFLLSAEEYEYYKDKIPHLRLWWWTRTEGKKKDAIATIDADGGVNYCGYHVSFRYNFVRPAVRFFHKAIGDKVHLYGYTWVIIDDGIAIAEMPIGIEQFDIGSNNYETSYIRKWLLDWAKERW